MTDDDEVLALCDGHAGMLTLNRPKALNALTRGMVRQIDAALTRWADDIRIRCVIIRGAGGRAFSAGGDIRAVHDLGRAGCYAEALGFWRDEYKLNQKIKRYPKPYVAVLDGIVMGGGVGISLHGSFRLAGERYSFAMPEVGIGFFPDVGATYALPRLPHNFGTYLALTGVRIGREDALALGLATHAVESKDIEDICQSLGRGEVIGEVLDRYALSPPPSPLSEHSEIVERVFSLNSVGEIMDALQHEDTPFARDTLNTMRTKSPTSMSIALEQMRRGKDLSFEDAMSLEMRIVTHVVQNHEFYEGVRAAIIDKDQSPRWQPASIDEIDPSSIDRYFGPIDNELTF